MSEIVKKLEEHINSFGNEFRNVQVDSKSDFAKEALFAKQALMNNDFLLNVARNNQQSLKDAILNIAAVGLSLNPVTKLAYLVPRKVGNKQAVCLDISYLGLIRAATDSGSIVWAQAELVYSEDDFTINVAGEKPVHKFNPFSKDRGEVLGCYVIAKTLEGDYLTEAMSMEEIKKIRDKSESWKNEKARKYSPWFNFESEMVKKTVIKRASKLWPKTDKSDRIEKAVSVVNEHEGIVFKSEYEQEQEDLEKDFPINPEDKIVGENYLVMNAKFRGKRLGEIDTNDLINYYDLLESRIKKEEKPKNWELELYNVIGEYMEMQGE